MYKFFIFLLLFVTLFNCCYPCDWDVNGPTPILTLENRNSYPYFYGCRLPSTVNNEIFTNKKVNINVKYKQDAFNVYDKIYVGLVATVFDMNTFQTEYICITSHPSDRNQNDNPEFILRYGLNNVPTFTNFDEKVDRISCNQYQANNVLHKCDYNILINQNVTHFVNNNVGVNNRFVFEINLYPYKINTQGYNVSTLC